MIDARPDGLTTNSDYWDCDCKEDYIHHRETEDHCFVCGKDEDEAPESRQDEIDANTKNFTVIRTRVEIAQVQAVNRYAAEYIANELVEDGSWNLKDQSFETYEEK